jgi:hypothetical protein
LSTTASNAFICSTPCLNYLSYSIVYALSCYIIICFSSSACIVSWSIYSNIIFFSAFSNFSLCICAYTSSFILAYYPSKFLYFVSFDFYTPSIPPNSYVINSTSASISFIVICSLFIYFFASVTISYIYPVLIITDKCSFT